MNRLVCQRYKQFACRVNQPASSWVALSAKWMHIFSLSDSFIEVHNYTPLYADSFDLNARHSHMSVTGIRCHSQVLRRCRSQVCGSIFGNYAPYSFYRTPVLESVGRLYPFALDARSCICGCPFVHLLDARTCICAYGRWVETLL